MTTGSPTILPRLVLMATILSGCISLSSAQNVKTVVVREGDNVTLPCVFPTNENIKEKLFDWKKDGQKEVFMYDRGDQYNNGRTGQDKQYKGRISYFEEQLEVGIASLLLMNTKVADSGRYSCHFPRLNEYKSYVDLIVSAVRQPRTKFVNVTETGVELMCELRGAFPEADVEWQDSNGKVVPAAEPLNSTDSEGRYIITLSVTVTKPDHYRCIAKQEKINHTVYDVIYVHERMFCKYTCMMFGVSVLGWVIGVILLVILVVLLAMKWKGIVCREDSAQQQLCVNCVELKKQKLLPSDHSPDDSVEGP